MTQKLMLNNTSYSWDFGGKYKLTRVSASVCDLHKIIVNILKIIINKHGWFYNKIIRILLQVCLQCFVTMRFTTASKPTFGT